MRWVELKLLTVRPRQSAGICSRVGNDSIHHHAGRSTYLTQLTSEDRQWFAGIGGIVGKTDTAHATGLVLTPDAGDERVPPRLFGRVEHRDGASTGRDHGAIGKTDPLVSILAK